MDKICNSPNLIIGAVRTIQGMAGTDEVPKKLVGILTLMEKGWKKSDSYQVLCIVVFFYNHLTYLRKFRPIWT